MPYDGLRKVPDSAGVIFGFFHLWYGVSYFGYFSFALHIGGGFIFGFLSLYVIGLASSLIIAYSLSKFSIIQTG